MEGGNSEPCFDPLEVHTGFDAHPDPIRSINSLDLAASEQILLGLFDTAFGVTLDFEGVHEFVGREFHAHERFSAGSDAALCTHLVQVPRRGDRS
ncbi:hypothetical protein [Nocardia sp. alder85J]|uniref:hypothetical protein n=1 Tax=Nocardia sp. alder85J TaxID=2862949 RepID=UPI001CD2E023|nr:hypothetical protein [Nocardia sp. alder85J]MCX4098237.1 hypothetical protein [Nocardia sp. alder85J]